MSVFRNSLLLVLLTACGGLVRAQTSPTLIGSTANLTVAVGSSAPPIDLSLLFGLPSVTGQIVQMQTNLGPINIELEPQAAPKSVADFLSYVTKGAYTNTIIHRTVPAPFPGFGIIQGGGFTVSAGSTSPTTIPTSASIPLEYNYPNARGTIAMARTSDPNSASDQWFINADDNTSTLGAGNGGGYAVFGRVIGSGMTVVDKIDALTTINPPGLDPNSFAAVPVVNYSSTAGFSYANWVRLPSVSIIPIYPDGTGAASVLSFTATSSNPAAVTATVSGKTLTMTGVAPGSASITVSAVDSNGGQASGVYNVTVGANFAISQQPADENVNAGSTAVLSVAANNPVGTTYQWLLNNAPISNGATVSGATSSHLVISPVSAANAGSYRCGVTSSTGTALTSSSAQLGLSATTNIGRLTNLSVISADVTANQGLIVGFIVGSGSPSLPLLMRGAGPALTAFGIPNVIPDPTVTLYNNVSAVLTSNQGWASTSANQSAVLTAEQVTVAFPYATNPASLDSALVQQLSPGLYSIGVQSASGKSGAALGEVYDDSTAFTAGNSHLINLSSRLAVGTGHALTAGFTISGNTAKTVLIRGVGPTLGAAPFNIPSVMSDPQLTLFPAGSISPLASNTVWNGDSQIAAATARVGAFTLPATSADSAILITLPPGGYTAQVTSASGAGGNALVEVYEVP